MEFSAAQCCPITHCAFEDPVLLVGDGHTYERRAIEHWLVQSDKSPVSGNALSSKRLVPNLCLRSIIKTPLKPVVMMVTDKEDEVGKEVFNGLTRQQLLTMVAGNEGFLPLIISSLRDAVFVGIGEQQFTFYHGVANMMQATSKWSMRIAVDVVSAAEHGIECTITWHKHSQDFAPEPSSSPSISIPVQDMVVRLQSTVGQTFVARARGTFTTTHAGMLTLRAIGSPVVGNGTYHLLLGTASPPSLLTLDGWFLLDDTIEGMAVLRLKQLLVA